MSCLKYSMMVVHLLIWVIGAVITALGIWMQADKSFWNIQLDVDLKHLTVATNIIINVGVLHMIIGFCGCWGAMRSKKWMLVVFSVLMIIVIILEITVIALVWTAVTSEKMQEDIKRKAKASLQQYNDDEKKKYSVDLLQRKLQCCGVDGPKDYSLDPKLNNTIPDSCMPKGSSTPYQKGCYEAVIEFLKSKAAIMVGVSVAVLFLQLGVLIFTIILTCSIKKPDTNIIYLR